MEAHNDEKVLAQILRAQGQVVVGEWEILELPQHLPQPQVLMEAAEGLEPQAWHSVFLVFVFVDGSKFPMQCEHALHSNDPSSTKTNEKSHYTREVEVKWFYSEKTSWNFISAQGSVLKINYTIPEPIDLD